MMAKSVLRMTDVLMVHVQAQDFGAKVASTVITKNVKLKTGIV